MTEFVGKDIFNVQLVAIAGNDGSCIITAAGDDDGSEPQTISIHKDDVPRLAAWLASIQQTKP